MQLVLLCVLHRSDDVISIVLLLWLSEQGAEEKVEDKQEEIMAIMTWFFQFSCLFWIKWLSTLQKHWFPLIFAFFWKNRILFLIYSCFLGFKRSQHTCKCIVYYMQHNIFSDCHCKFNICSQFLHVDIRVNLKLHFSYHWKVWLDSYHMQNNALTTIDTLINSWISALELYLVCCAVSYFMFTRTILCRCISLLPFIFPFSSSPNENHFN